MKKIKKFVSLVLSLSLVSSISSSMINAGALSKEAKIVVIGDIDMSGEIDMNDLSLFSMYLLGDAELSDEQKIIANTNDDDSLNILDLVNLKQYISKCSGGTNVVIGEKRIIDKTIIEREPEPEKYPIANIIPGADCEQPEMPLTID